MSTQNVIDRIARMIGQDVIGALADLPMSELNSLLLQVFERQLQHRTPPQLLRDYERSPFCGVSELNQLALLEFTRSFEETFNGRFEAVEVSPAVPIGTNSILTPVSQNNVLSALRGLELAGDPTTALALEAASRRKRDNTSPVHLCTDHRIIRLQWFDPELGYMQHFRCGGLVSADRKYGHGMKPEMFRRHVQAHLDFFVRLQREGLVLRGLEVLFSNLGFVEGAITAKGYQREQFNSRTSDETFNAFDALNINLPTTTIELEDLDCDIINNLGLDRILRRLKGLHRVVLNPLKQANPDIMFGYDLARVAGMGYYTGECFHIFATTQDGLRLQLSDGGFTNWTSSMLSDGREVSFISGFGSELIKKMY